MSTRQRFAAVTAEVRRDKIAAHVAAERGENPSGPNVYGNRVEKAAKTSKYAGKKSAKKTIKKGIKSAAKAVVPRVAPAIAAGLKYTSSSNPIGAVVSTLTSPKTAHAASKPQPGYKAPSGAEMRRWNRMHVAQQADKKRKSVVGHGGGGVRR